MEVIYLVTPTLETINLILKDFADPKKPRYGNVHLFFLSKVGCDFIASHRVASHRVTHTLSLVCLRCWDADRQTPVTTQATYTTTPLPLVIRSTTP
jgi:hypothetical protein